MTVREAAELLGCHPSTVRRWIQRGKLKAEQVQDTFGPTYIIDPAELAALGFKDTPGDDKGTTSVSPANISGGESAHLAHQLGTLQTSVETVLKEHAQLRATLDKILKILELQEDAHRKSRDQQLTAVLRSMQEHKHTRSSRRLMWSH
ncbi:MAG: helix-turn-helix domain-containing protein [Alicyclobacillus herbarius]|nr:helix-turn-helix domain-containing protein [Alicyclobacillus herbarius]MCL6631900.1 helix-turn-helix domain-containing protein [Alicyclobacillus herbarius]